MKFKSNISKEINLFGLNWKKKKEIYNKIDKKIMKSIFFLEGGEIFITRLRIKKKKKKSGGFHPFYFLFCLLWVRRS